MSVSKKDKILKKGAKMKKSLKRKMLAKKAKITGVLASLACAALICGCQSTPSRSQSMSIKYSTFYVMLPPGWSPTNAVCAEGAASGVIGDLFTQNQVVENSGTETLTPTHTVCTISVSSMTIGSSTTVRTLLATRRAPRR